MPVIIGGNKEQQKKYLGRLIEEPLVAVSLLLYQKFVHLTYKNYTCRPMV